MGATAISGTAVMVTALGLVLTGCGSGGDTATEPATSAPAAAPSTARIAPREGDAPGPHPTIASYIAEHGIQETPVKRGDPGAPVLDLPVPSGWEDAGDSTPEWAYRAIIYTSPEAAEYTPSIVALVSKLTGDVEPQAIIHLAPGELQNLPGWSPLNEGEASSLGDYPAYQLGGTWDSEGKTKVVAQKTVVIPGDDGLYVLQLNADGLVSQAEIVGAATTVIDDQTTISF